MWWKTFNNLNVGGNILDENQQKKEVLVYNNDQIDRKNIDMDNIAWISKSLIEDLLLEAKRNPINIEWWYTVATNMYSYKINGKTYKRIAKDYKDTIWKLKNIEWININSLKNLWKVEKAIIPKGNWFTIGYKLWNWVYDEIGNKILSYDYKPKHKNRTTRILAQIFWVNQKKAVKNIKFIEKEVKVAIEKSKKFKEVYNTIKFIKENKDIPELKEYYANLDIEKIIIEEWGKAVEETLDLTWDMSAIMTVWLTTAITKISEKALKKNPAFNTWNFTVKVIERMAKRLKVPTAVTYWYSKTISEQNFYWAKYEKYFTKYRKNLLKVWINTATEWKRTSNLNRKVLKAMRTTWAEIKKKIKAEIKQEYNNLVLKEKREKKKRKEEKEHKERLKKLDISLWGVVGHVFYENHFISWYHKWKNITDPRKKELYRQRREYVLKNIKKIEWSWWWAYSIEKNEKTSTLFPKWSNTEGTSQTLFDKSFNKWDIKGIYLNVKKKIEKDPALLKKIFSEKGSQYSLTIKYKWVKVLVSYIKDYKNPGKMILTSMYPTFKQ